MAHPEYIAYMTLALSLGAITYFEWRRACLPPPAEK